LKKVIATKNCNSEFFKKLVEKMWKVIQRLKFAFCAIPFLLSAGCAESIEEKPEATSVPTPTATAVTEHIASDPVITPEPLPTNTPMDASFITPAPSSTPLQIYIPTEEEQKTIDDKIETMCNNLFDMTPKSFGETLSKEEAISIINCFRLDFRYVGYLNDKEYLEAASEEEIVIIKDYVYESLMATFMASINNYFISYVSDSVKSSSDVKSIDFKRSEMFELLPGDNYKGLETLKIMQDLTLKVGESASRDWETFESNTISMQKLIEAVFINHSGDFEGIEITDFNNMHPCVQLVLLFEAQKGLNYVRERSMKEDKQIKTDFYTLQLIDELAKIFNSSKIKDGIFPVIDAYIAMVVGGTYDAYLTGDATRKAIIRTLCIEGKANLY